MIVNRPPMGWNSWNTFGENINENMIKEMADAMVDGGYLDAGYEYLVIDDCWSEL
ncbi:MAG: glycoside hydrolase family 27 protein, partial [Clostridia bacterium]|nr:glycoside hydrolase family 27 protein [Clostridia bacterium]